MIVFVRSYIAEFDARLGKYFQALGAAGLPYRFIGWNKDGRQTVAPDGSHYYQRRARLGAGWANLLALLGWNLYVLRQLMALRGQVRVVHAVDLDTAVAAWLFCLVFRRRLVFDLYDKYTAVRNIGGLPGRLIDALESGIARHAALTLIASEERRAQHRLEPRQSNVVVLENVPQAEVGAAAPPHAIAPWKIGYFGVLEPRHRGLEDLLAACGGRPDVELHIAGYGGLADHVASVAARSGNVHLHGAMSSGSGLALMAGMDVLVGFYYLSVPNHAHASPNKYYEHLMLGRPMATTQGTPPGERVRADGTGWALPEGREAIAAWLDTLDAAQILQRGARARAIWDQRYASYLQQHYQGVYVSRIRLLLGETHAG
ncbi:glycosyltransferase family 4 protein [Bordetella genomosp. 13]|uniref:glycosyltransferase family 4 protein n=1 Tax=Bordetella genomosp. 13 TaxID=463040 RepID=UPI0011A556DC|nr:glycosyltransferase family 4 protein [Bordetella genomosp. 13]